MASHSNLTFMQCLFKTRSKLRKSSQNFEYSLHEEVTRNSRHIYRGVTPLVWYHITHHHKTTLDGLCYKQIFLTPYSISDQKRISISRQKIQAHVKKRRSFYLSFNNSVSQGIHILGIEGMFQCSHLINTAAQGPNIRLKKGKRKCQGTSY